MLNFGLVSVDIYYANSSNSIFILRISAAFFCSILWLGNCSFCCISINTNHARQLAKFWQHSIYYNLQYVILISWQTLLIFSVSKNTY